MNELENNRSRNSSTGRSRARGTNRSGASGRSASSSRSSFFQKQLWNIFRPQKQFFWLFFPFGRKPFHQTEQWISQKEGPNYKIIAIAGVVLIVFITGISLALKGKGSNTDTAGTETVIESEAETEMQKEVQVMVSLLQECPRAKQSSYFKGIPVEYDSRI